MMPSDKPDFTAESPLIKQGYVIGIDEAGRGPWAGPVCAAAFWIDPRALDMLPPGLTDSKKLSVKKRADIYHHLTKGPHACEAAFSSVQMIDDIGILQANFAAMKMAADTLARRLIEQDPLGLATSGKCEVARVFVDGNLLPDLNYPAEAVIKGDSKILSVAAASVIAKQKRDAYMAELHEAYPVYGWDRNQGYGTKAHRQALSDYGITDHHRRSFAPIRKLKERQI
ncbi:MAG: ribonuclease HII [Candidatus Puniceispirillaceae bacterium]